MPLGKAERSDTGTAGDFCRGLLGSGVCSMARNVKVIKRVLNDIHVTIVLNSGRLGQIPPAVRVLA